MSDDVVVWILLASVPVLALTYAALNKMDAYDEKVRNRTGKGGEG